MEERQAFFGRRVPMLHWPACVSCPHDERRHASWQRRGISENPSNTIHATLSLHEHDETIAAIASPTSPAIRGIVRLSGSDSLQILDRISGPACRSESQARRQRWELDLGDPFGVVPVDVLLWRTSRSYTGQPSVEIHTDGCLPLLESIVDTAIAGGARAAKPGEFTMRAFLAGRLDLTQAEAVLGVIDAEGRGSLDHALRQLAGNVFAAPGIDA